MDARFSLRQLAGVLRRNPAFRRLYAANAISLCGDWLNIVALYSLLVELTGRGEAVAWALLLHLVPQFVLGPAAGVLADRLPRKTILVTCDLARAALVLGLLLVRAPGQVWIAYAVTLSHAVLSAFFEPAMQATMPGLVPPEDLVFAGTLENSLWSLGLAAGSALGGLALATVGRDAAFVLDALSFVGSALLVRNVPIGRPQSDRMRAEVREDGRLPAEQGWSNLLGLSDLREGARYLLGEPRVRAIIFVKSCFGLTLGGVLVLLSWFGERVFDGRGGSGIAVLYFARGVGSLFGPLVAFKVLGHGMRSLARAIGVAYAIIAVCYLAFAVSPALWAAAVALAVAAGGGSILWTAGSTLQQLVVPEPVRGRVAAADMAGMTMCMSASTWLSGALLDRGAPARALMAACGLVAVAPLAFWLANLRRFQMTAGAAAQ